MEVIARRIGTQFEHGPQSPAFKRSRAAQEAELAEPGEKSGAVISVLVEVVSEAVKGDQEMPEAAQSSTTALGGELYHMRLQLEVAQSAEVRLRKHIQQNCIDISYISRGVELLPGEAAKLTTILDTLEHEVAYRVFEVAVGRRTYVRLRKPEEVHARASIKM